MSSTSRRTLSACVANRDARLRSRVGVRGAGYASCVSRARIMPWRVISVRGYFLTIVTLALLAAFVLVVDLTTQQRRQLTAAAAQQASQLARLAASAHERAL